MSIASIILIIFVIFLAVWRRDIFFYIIACPVSIVAGLYWRGYQSTNLGLVLSITLVGIGLYCLIMAIYNLANKLRD